MKCFVVLCASALASLSVASYDLMYMPDASGDKIHRFDPVSRTYLGAINTYTNTSYVAVSPNGTRVAGFAGQIYEYDPATGTPMNTVAAGLNRGLSYIDNASLRYSVLGTITKGTITSVQTSFSAGINLTVARILDLPNGNIFALSTNLANDLVAGLYTPTGTLIGSLLTVASAANLAANAAVGSIGLGASSSTPNPLFFTYRSNTNQMRLGRVAVSTTFNTLTLQTGSNLSAYSVANAATEHNIVKGHDGMMWIVGADAATPTLTRITGFRAYTASSIVQMSSYTTSSFAVPITESWSGGNVVAPEPSSMLGIGLAAIALMRRKK